MPVQLSAVILGFALPLLLFAIFGFKKIGPIELASDHVSVSSRLIAAAVGLILIAIIIPWNGLLASRLLPVTPSSPTSQPPAATQPSSNPTAQTIPTQPAASNAGNSAQVNGLTMTVNRVEIVRYLGDGKMLRFHISVDNQTTDALTLPIYGYFVAVDSSGQSYDGDAFRSDWPDTFPSGLNASGSIDLTDPVPSTASTISISFTQVFGTFEVDSITINDIAIP